MFFKKEKCPICDYYIKPNRKYPASSCQCRFGGSTHPDRSKNQEVVLEHLHLLSKKQIKHIIGLEKYWQISYGDEERTTLLVKLEENKNEQV